MRNEKLVFISIIRLLFIILSFWPSSLNCVKFDPCSLRPLYNEQFFKQFFRYQFVSFTSVKNVKTKTITFSKYREIRIKKLTMTPKEKKQR